MPSFWKWTRERAGLFLARIRRCVSAHRVVFVVLLLISLLAGFIMDEDCGPFALVHSRGNVSDLVLSLDSGLIR